MLDGFPKKVTVTKLSRGHYRLNRDDDYSIEVRSSGQGYWYQTSNLVRFKSLGVAVFDMERGYMARDQVGASNAKMR